MKPITTVPNNQPKVVMSVVNGFARKPAVMVIDVPGNIPWLQQPRNAKKSVDL
jgi:hypothetical protein